VYCGLHFKFRRAHYRSWNTGTYLFHPQYLHFTTINNSRAVARGCPYLKSNWFVGSTINYYIRVKCTRKSQEPSKPLSVIVKTATVANRFSYSLSKKVESEFIFIDSNRSPPIWPISEQLKIANFPSNIFWIKFAHSISITGIDFWEMSVVEAARVLNFPGH
jgi:hypothetical protein